MADVTSDPGGDDEPVRAPGAAATVPVAKVFGKSVRSRRRSPGLFLFPLGHLASHLVSPGVAVPGLLGRSRTFLDKRAAALAALEQVEHDLPASCAAPSPRIVRSVRIDGVVMMAVKDFQGYPLALALDRMSASSFIAILMVAANQCHSTTHRGFFLREMIAVLSGLDDVRTRPILDWMVDAYPDEALVVGVVPRPPGPDIVSGNDVVDPIAPEISQQAGMETTREIPRELPLTVPALAVSKWRDAVPVDWSMVEGRAMIDRAELTVYLDRLGLDGGSLLALVREVGAGIDADGLGDLLDLPVLAAMVEPAPVFRAWLALVRLAVRRAAIDRLEVELSSYLLDLGQATEGDAR